MIPSIETLTADVIQDLTAFFFDIDDTFTTKGRIPAVAFQALWKLREYGIRTVPITGRPAGWCDHIARMWPVDGVVGENGAFYFWMDEGESKLRKRFFDADEARREKRLRLRAIGDKILRSVPGTALASDQRYREADLAIDYREDVPPLDRKDVDAICAIFRSHGAQCKVSSIHVNGWFGDYDKLSMTNIFIREHWGLDPDRDRYRFFFCGDSPNDEPMFRHFPCSAGVNNLLRFADDMTAFPSFIAHREGGEGFAEIVDTLLRHR